MNTLLTGSTGFLGSRVHSLLQRGSHSVRCLARKPIAGADTFVADLLKDDLTAAFDGVETLIHLATPVGGDDTTLIADTARITERLLAAMAASEAKHLVLASSFSVYDFSRIGRSLSEASPIGGDAFVRRDTYANAKLKQETACREAAARNGWSLSVLRPGFIWGRGRELPSGIGQAAGPAFAVVAPMAKSYLTHVDNCAAAFALAAAQPAAGTRTLNIIDDHGTTNWQFARAIAARLGWPKLLLPMPYAVGMTAATLAGALHLPRPGLLIAERFAARFAHATCSGELARNTLGWRPVSFDDCLAATFGSEALPADVTMEVAQ